MNDHHTDALQVLSVLLHYPDEDLLNGLAEIESLAANLPLSETKPAIQAFIGELKTQPLIRVQERYTAVFDMDPATTLNITYHAFGDNEKRAAALANLQHNYAQAGWIRVTGELPDYLPLMLEFLYGLSAPGACRAGLAVLARHAAAGSPSGRKGSGLCGLVATACQHGNRTTVQRLTAATSHRKPMRSPQEEIHEPL